MFEGDPEARTKARSVVRKLSSYSANKSHTRHIHVDECEEIGLDVERLESDPKLQDLVLSAHHCFSLTFTSKTAFKIIENHLGNAFVKSQAQQQIAIPQLIPVQQPTQQP